MMRSLWTAASGMTAQQLNVDTIANNIANVNTTGFKRERLEFKTLLYQTMERATLDPATNIGKPVNLQVGLGVRPIVSSKTFTNGSFERTENPLDVAIQGEGFFVIDTGNDVTAYTRDGSFKLSINEDEATFVTSDGYFLLNSEGENITIPANIPQSRIAIDQSGYVSYIDDGGELVTLDAPIGMVQFPNPQGLESIGKNLFIETGASGGPLSEAEDETVDRSTFVQNYKEMSNVNIAEEMVNLIVAQRAYELNSKAITTSDQMLQTANGLKN